MGNVEARWRPRDIGAERLQEGHYQHRARNRPYQHKGGQRAQHVIHGLRLATSPKTLAPTAWHALRGDPCVGDGADHNNANDIRQQRQDRAEAIHDAIAMGAAHKKGARNGPPPSRWHMTCSCSRRAPWTPNRKPTACTAQGWGKYTRMAIPITRQAMGGQEVRSGCTMVQA